MYIRVFMVASTLKYNFHSLMIGKTIFVIMKSEEVYFLDHFPLCTICNEFLVIREGTT